MKAQKRPPPMSETSMGGGGLWEALTKTLERPPPMSKTSMAAPLGGTDEDPGAPTTYVEDIDGNPLGGTNEDPGGPTTYVEDVNGRPPGRSCLCLRSQVRRHKVPLGPAPWIGR
jgi:hypothetical protein